VNNTTSDSRLQSWTTNVTDALGAFAAVWGVALGVLIVGVPIALVVALALRLGRMVFSGL
jgi:orotate phosphoribosyltransferase-like protein